MPDLGELEGDLKKKEGPLPIWGWAVLVLGAGAVVVIIRRRAASTVTNADGSTQTAVPTTDAAPAVNALSGQSAASGAADDDSTDQQANGATSYADNGAWSSAAALYLEADGFSSTTVDAFLSDYLGGQPLTAQETALKVLALAALGYPPVSIATSSSAANTTTTTDSTDSGTGQGMGALPTGRIIPPTPGPTVSQGTKAPVSNVAVSNGVVVTAQNKSAVQSISTGIGLSALGKKLVTAVAPPTPKAPTPAQKATAVTAENAFLAQLKAVPKTVPVVVKKK